MCVCVCYLVSVRPESLVPGGNHGSSALVMVGSTYLFKGSCARVHPYRTPVSLQRYGHPTLSHLCPED